MLLAPAHKQKEFLARTAGCVYGARPLRGRMAARVAIEETIRVLMEKGADDDAIEKATLAIDAKTGNEWTASQRG